MNKFSKILLSTLAFSTFALVGCGGGSDAVVTTPAARNPASNIDMSVAALFTYLSEIVAGTSDSVEVIDVNGLTLATDDTVEPTALN
jgi:hypothetical protein